MPFDRSRYPDYWENVSRFVRFIRARGRCECTGQCGHSHPGGRCDAVHGAPHPLTGTLVVLTTAHYPDRDPQNCDLDNLFAGCQRCHLSADMDEHVRNRRYGRHHDREHQTKLAL